MYLDAFAGRLPRCAPAVPTHRNFSRVSSPIGWSACCCTISTANGRSDLILEVGSYFSSTIQRLTNRQQRLKCIQKIGSGIDWSARENVCWRSETVESWGHNLTWRSSKHHQMPRRQAPHGVRSLAQIMQDENGTIQRCVLTIEHVHGC